MDDRLFPRSLPSRLVPAGSLLRLTPLGEGGSHWRLQKERIIQSGNAAGRVEQTFRMDLEARAGPEVVVSIAADSRDGSELVKEEIAHRLRPNGTTIEFTGVRTFFRRGKLVRTEDIDRAALKRLFRARFDHLRLEDLPASHRQWADAVMKKESILSALKSAYVEPKAARVRKSP